jgi:hypothetical protein
VSERACALSGLNFLHRKFPFEPPRHALYSMQAKICSCDFRSSCPFQPAARRITFYEYITSAGWEQRESNCWERCSLAACLHGRPPCNNKTVSFGIMDGAPAFSYSPPRAQYMQNKGVHTISPNHNKQALFFHLPNVHFVSQGCYYCA